MNLGLKKIGLGIWIALGVMNPIQESFALSPIIRTYQSVRAAAMGNVRYTTGEFEENFFANPGRITENPVNRRIQLPKITLEAGSGMLGTLGKLMGTDSSGFSNLSGSVGKPLSARFQLLFPAYYTGTFITRDWSFGIAHHVSAQLVGQFSQSGMVNPSTVITVGPALTLARRLLPEDRLTLGLNTHLNFRATSGNPFSIADLLKGNIADSLRGGSGIGLDFDLGTTFRPHWGLGGFDYEVGFAINHLLGGTYENLGGRASGWNKDPIPTPRSFNFGVAARHDELWKFKSFLLALEFTDIGNNVNGSFFRTIHFGSEAKWKSLAFRFGVNQGYLCGGIGFDVKFFSLNLSTYGEELGLNVGVLEDRRYALDFGFQI